MSAHVICITSGSGLPVFSRKKGNVENLPFSVIGSLNGVHMFGKSQNMLLLNTLTEDYNVVWNEFEESLILIAISTGCAVDVLNKLLETIFNAIVLIVGIDEVQSQRNIERLKRELKICYPTIDRLMDSLDCGVSSNKHNSDILGLAECIMCTENHMIQIMWESYTEYVDSLFSCILIHGKIAAATDSWWSLHSDEIKLLSLLAASENTTSSKDVPVFLPYKSPTVAFRFVSCTLMTDVQICSLCGATPTLEEIEHSAAQCFKSSTDILSAAVSCFPRNFPSHYQVDGSILGLLLINVSIGKYMMSKNPQQSTTKKVATSSHRLDILRTFYYQAVSTVLVDDAKMKEANKDFSKKLEKKKQLADNSNPIDFNIGKETYWCSEYHKCHGLLVGDNILCVLYNSTIPTYAMRLITQKTLKMLVSDKQVCW